MQENYEHYISKNIKSLYCKRLFGPVIYLIFSVVLWCTLPIASVVFPSELSKISDMGSMYAESFKLYRLYCHAF